MLEKISAFSVRRYEPCFASHESTSRCCQWQSGLYKVTTVLSTFEGLIEQYVLHGLETYFPPPICPKRAEWMSPATFRIRSHRSVVSRLCVLVGAKLARAAVSFVFKFWAAFKSRVRSRPWWCRVRGPCSKYWCIRQHYLVAARSALTRSFNVAKADDLSAWLCSKTNALEEAALETCSR